VVEMRVGEQERVEVGGLEGERHLVAFDLLRRPLEHAAVDEDAALSHGHQELGSGDAAGGTKELDLDAHWALHVRSIGAREAEYGR
jgi:hypothetical protein